MSKVFIRRVGAGTRREATSICLGIKRSKKHAVISPESGERYKIRTALLCERGIPTIERRKHAASEKRTQFFREVSEPLYDKIGQIGSLWGFRSPTHFQVILESTEKAISEHYVLSTRNKEAVQCMPDEELPLHINDPKMQEHISARFEGRLPAIPKRQDLLDRYTAASRSQMRLGKIIRICEGVIITCARQLCHEIVSDPYEAQGYLRLIINGREYLYSLRSKNPTSLIKPEDVLETVIFEES